MLVQVCADLIFFLPETFVMQRVSSAILAGRFPCFMCGYNEEPHEEVITSDGSWVFQCRVCESMMHACVAADRLRQQIEHQKREEFNGW